MHIVWDDEIMMFICFLFQEETTSTAFLVSLVTGKSRCYVSNCNKVTWKREPRGIRLLVPEGLV